MDALTFQTEVRRIEKLMYRVSMSYLENVEDAADAVQDTLIKAWEKRSTLIRPEQFKPWVMRILVNQCKDVLRKRRRRSFFPLEEDTASVEVSVTQTPVMEAICALDPELRTVIVLHYVDGYAVQEIASSLGLPLGTVKTRMRSARKRLKQTLLVEWEDVE
ncbi:MAG: RNA polymerase sigma factor [Aristaeellaceae bacterium]